MVGRTYQVKRRHRKGIKKEGNKRLGGRNRKKRKKKKKEEKKKGKRKKKGEVNKTSDTIVQFFKTGRRKGGRR